MLDHCIRHKAQYVIAPCCAGFMQNTLKNHPEHVVPTSKKLREAGGGGFLVFCACWGACTAIESYKHMFYLLLF